MRIKYSTADTRAERLSSSLVPLLLQLDLETHGHGPYQGDVELDVGSPVIFGRVFGSPARFRRTAERVEEAAEGVWVLLSRHGTLRVSQGDVDASLEAGDGVIFDGERPLTGECVGETDTFVVRVPGRMLEAHHASAQANTTTLLSRSAETTCLMLGVLEAYARLGAELTEAASLRTGLYLADLVRMALETNVHAARLAPASGLRGMRTRAILAEIGRRFAEPSFSIKDVAKTQRLSTRYVHLLLKDTGATFSEQLTERRLIMARHLLGDPMRRFHRVADVAYAAGFSDVSYFNRRYRERFLETPSDTRETLAALIGSRD